MCRRTISFLMCVFLLLVILPGLCRADASGADGLELRVMTFNIRYGQ
jgi:hypothetical protein